MTSDERYNAMLLSELNFEGFGSFHSVSIKDYETFHSTIFLENIKGLIKSQLYQHSIFLLCIGN